MLLTQIAKHATEKEHYCYEQMYKKNSKLIGFSATYFGVHPIDVISRDSGLMEQVNINTLHRADSLRYIKSLSDIHIDETGGKASTNEFIVCWFVDRIEKGNRQAI